MHPIVKTVAGHVWKAILGELKKRLLASLFRVVETMLAGLGLHWWWTH